MLSKPQSVANKDKQSERICASMTSFSGKVEMSGCAANKTENRIAHTHTHTRTPKISCTLLNLLILSSRFIDRTDSNRPDRILCLFPPAAPVAMRPASVGFKQHRRRGPHFSHGMRWYAMRLFSLLALKT